MSQAPMVRVGGPLDGEEPEIPLIALVTTVLRHWRKVVALPLVGAMVGVLFGLLTRAYEATARFMPRSGESEATRLAGLAAQFGLSVGAGTGGESVAFYETLVVSRELLEGAVETLYVFPIAWGGADTLEGTYLDLYDIEGATPIERLRAGVTRLRHDIRVSGDVGTGLVTVTVKARWRGLAEQLSRRLLEAVNDYNVQRRRTQATQERQFVEERIDEVREELRQAEDELQTFLTANRTYRESPRLVFEEQRLERRVSLLHQVHTTLSQAYEQARIEEVRTTPVLTIVERPEGSAINATSLKLLAIVGFVVGGAIAVVWMLGTEFLASQKYQHPGAYAEFHDELATVRKQILPRRH